jgi:hypothetical protein
MRNPGFNLQYWGKKKKKGVYTISSALSTTYFFHLTVFKIQLYLGTSGLCLYNPTYSGDRNQED